MDIREAAKTAPKLEDIREMVDAYKPLLQQASARTAVGERWRDLVPWIFRTREEWDGYVPSSDYQIQQWENLTWNDTFDCIAPKGSPDEFHDVWATAWNAASTRFTTLRERYIEVLSPDTLESAVNTAQKMLMVYAYMHKMYRQHNDTGGSYAGEGQIEYNPGAFEEIEALFESWKGESSEAAWDAFGNARDVVKEQLGLAADLADSSGAEAGLLINIRMSFAEQLDRLAQSVDAVLKDNNYVLVEAFNWAGVAYPPLGAGITAAGTMERLFGSQQSLREIYDGEEPEKGWFTRFMEFLVIDVEGSLTSQDAEEIFSILEEIVGDVEASASSARDEIKNGLGDVSEELHTNLLVQGVSE